MSHQKLREELVQTKSELEKVSRMATDLSEELKKQEQYYEKELEKLSDQLKKVEKVDDSAYLVKIKNLERRLTEAVRERDEGFRKAKMMEEELE